MAVTLPFNVERIKAVWLGNNHCHTTKIIIVWES